MNSNLGTISPTRAIPKQIKSESEAKTHLSNLSNSLHFTSHSKKTKCNVQTSFIYLVSLTPHHQTKQEEDKTRIILIMLHESSQINSFLLIFHLSTTFFISNSNSSSDCIFYFYSFLLTNKINLITRSLSWYIIFSVHKLSKCHNTT